MPSLLTEAQVLKQLKIKDFRHVSKEKVMTFASLLNRMEPDVAKKAIEQFPEFTKMTLEIMNEYKGIVTKTLDSNSESNQRSLEILDEIIAALKTCLAQDDLSFDEKRYYVEKMEAIGKLAVAKDSENKKFLWQMIGIGSVVVISAIGIGATLLGGNINFKLPKIEN